MVSAHSVTHPQQGTFTLWGTGDVIFESHVTFTDNIEVRRVP